MIGESAMLCGEKSCVDYLGARTANRHREMRRES